MLDLSVLSFSFLIFGRIKAMDGAPLIGGEEPTLPLKLKFCYSVGHVLNDVCASMWFTYLLVFFHLVLGWPAEMAGIVMLIGQVADALATPFVGLQSDKRGDGTSCWSQYGHRKIWHLFGTICVLLSFPFIFAPCIECKSAHVGAQLVYYAAFVCIFQFGWASVQISHLSLIPELTSCEHERTSLIARRYTFTVVSNVLVYCVTWAVLHISNCDAPIGPKDANKFQMVVWIGLAVGAICAFIFHLGVKEKKSNEISQVVHDSSDPESVLPTPKKETDLSVQKTPLDHLCSVNFYKVAGVYMGTRLFTNLSQVYIPLYLHELGLGAQSLAVVPLIMFLSSLATSFIVKPANKFLGRKIAFVIGCMIGLGTSVWVYFGAGTIYTTYEVYCVGVLIGASGSILLVTSLGLTADLIGTHTGSGAFVYGAMSFVDKLSNGVAVTILQYYMNHNYRNVLSFVCGGATVVALISLIAMVVSCRKNTEPENGGEVNDSLRTDLPS